MPKKIVDKVSKFIRSSEISSLEKIRGLLVFWKYPPQPPLPFRPFTYERQLSINIFFYDTNYMSASYIHFKDTFTFK